MQFSWRATSPASGFGLLAAMGAIASGWPGNRHVKLLKSLDVVRRLQCASSARADRQPGEQLVDGLVGDGLHGARRHGGPALAAAPRRLLALNAVQAVAGGVEHVPDINDRRPGPFRDRRE